MKKSISIKITSLLTVSLMILSLAACGSNSSKENETSKSAVSTTAQASSTPESVDPLGKYDPGIELTAWRYQASSTQFIEGDTIDNNIWTKGWLNDLGLKLNYKWVVPDTQFDQRLNTSIAAGDLPDLMVVHDKQLKDMAENDLLFDLSSIYEKYASPQLKEVMNQDTTSFNTAKVADKLMAIPAMRSSYSSLPVLWYRADWVKKLGLSKPKTMQDVLALAEAITKNDPDGNGKNDTYGIAVAKDFLNPTTGVGGLVGYFNGFHAYQQTWIKDASGNLVYGSIQPEIKTALAELQRLYKEGVINKEFGVKDQGKVAEDIVSSKVGIMFGFMWNPLYPFTDNVKKDLEADWDCIAIPSVDAKTATVRTAVPVTDYYVVNKECKNPEALVKIANYFIDKVYPYSKNYDVNFQSKGEEKPLQIDYSFVNIDPPNKNLDQHFHIMEALKTKDASKLTPEEASNYEQAVKYLEEGPKSFGLRGGEILGSETSAFWILNNYIKDNSIVYDAFYGAPTDTMADKKASLEQLEIETFTKIILGDSIDKFDTFVSDWKKLGGDQITKEVNDRFAK